MWTSLGAALQAVEREFPLSSDQESLHEAAALKEACQVAQALDWLLALALHLEDTATLAGVSPPPLRVMVGFRVCSKSGLWCCIWRPWPPLQVPPPPCPTLFSFMVGLLIPWTLVPHLEDTATIAERERERAFVPPRLIQTICLLRYNTHLPAAHQRQLPGHKFPSLSLLAVCLQNFDDSSRRCGPRFWNWPNERPRRCHIGM